MRTVKHMKQIRFSRAGKRRFNSRVNSMVSLLKKNDDLFRREWQKLLQGWLYEVRHRANNWREGAEVRNVESVVGLVELGRARIFGVLDIAEATLAACGEDAEKLVGEETRRLIANECVKAVATICDGQLNYIVNHRVNRRASY
jgi:hypothetical protein